MNRTFCLAILGIVAMTALPLRAQKQNSAVEVMVEDMQVSQLGVSVTLRANQTGDAIHLLIGLTEGQAIVRALRHDAPARPQTHDLIKEILDQTGWRVQKVVIRDLVNSPTGGTYIADLVLERNGQTQVVDARPSDAMAVAVRANAHIYVEPKVFEIERQQEQQLGPEEEKNPSKEDTLHL